MTMVGNMLFDMASQKYIARKSTDEVMSCAVY